jgi:hypothetical protein
MLNPDQIGAWFTGLLTELGRVPEYASQLGVIGSFFGDLGRSIWEHVLATNEDLRKAVQR